MNSKEMTDSKNTKNLSFSKPEGTVRSRIDGGGGFNKPGGWKKFIKSNKRGEGVGIRGGRIFIISTTKIWLFVTESVCKRVLQTFGKENY